VPVLFDDAPAGFFAAWPQRPVGGRRWSRVGQRISHAAGIAVLAAAALRRPTRLAPNP